MNKKLIRLTESDLHRIVKESVNKVLTELDWKTYANAEKAARGRDTSYWREKGYEPRHDAIVKAADSRMRASRFADAAKDAFNRDYGYKNGERWDDDYAEAKFGGDFDSSQEFAPHAVGYRSKGWGNPKKYEFGTDNDTLQSVTPEEFYQGNEDAANAYHNADNEIKNWKKGNYDYQNGKGWQLKK